MLSFESLPLLWWVLDSFVEGVTIHLKRIFSVCRDREVRDFQQSGFEMNHHKDCRAEIRDVHRGRISDTCFVEVLQPAAQPAEKPPVPTAWQRVASARGSFTATGRAAIFAAVRLVKHGGPAKGGSSVPLSPQRSALCSRSLLS